MFCPFSRFDQSFFFSPMGSFLLAFSVFSRDSQLGAVFMSLSALVSIGEKTERLILHFCNSLSLANGKEMRRLTISHALSQYYLIASSLISSLNVD